MSKIMTELTNLNLFDEIFSLQNITDCIFKKTKSISKNSRASYEMFKLYGDVIAKGLYYLVHNKQFYTQFKQFALFDRKQRLIISPTTANSIIQRCIYEKIYFAFFKHFSPFTHSSILNRSTLTANKKIREIIHKNKNKNYYYLKTDFQNFYGSINSKILFDKLQIHIKDLRLLKFLRIFVFRGKKGYGIPFGNLLSQLFGNFYVTDLDYLITKNFSNYVRFADDIILFEKLDFLKEKLNLMLKYNKENKLKFSYYYFNRIENPFTFCGIKHYKDFSLLENRHKNTEAIAYNNINKQNKTQNKINIL